jgi:acylphosphatase
MEQIHCTISGRVQQVFLRTYIKECADVHKVTGFVRNLENGTVEVVAEGNSETLTKFLADIRRGSALSQIDSVDAVWSHARHQFDHFSIKHD